MAIYSVIAKVGYAGLAALFLVGGAGPETVAMASVTGLGLALLAAATLLLRRLRLQLVLDWATWRQLFLGGLPFFVWQAALLVYGQVDAVLLSFVTQDAVVGWYSAAYRVVTIPLFLPTIIMTVVFPALSATAQRPDACAALARRAVHVVLLSGVPMVLGIMLLSDKIIGVLGYGPSFDHSIVPMVLLAPHIALVGVNMVIGTVLNTRDRQRAWAGAAVVAAVLNPALNLPLISYAQAAFGNGAIGAAFVTTLTELFMFAAGLYLLPRGVLGRQTVVDATRCLIAALAMCGAVWFTRELAVVVPVALGGLVYAAVCLLIGAVSLHDLELVRRHLLGDRAVEPTPTPRRDLELAS
jgi:O-antigen/teichoic acid export membrane protein